MWLVVNANSNQSLPSGHSQPTDRSNVDTQSFVVISKEEVSGTERSGRGNIELTRKCCHEDYMFQHPALGGQDKFARKTGTI